MAKTRVLVEITGRDLQLFQTLNAAGWLHTRQIRDRFFPGKSTNAVCKRLRKLVSGNYLGMTRQNSTECAWYRLAGQGRLALIERDRLAADAITIPSQLPRKLKHFAAINDLRFAFERLDGENGASLQFFCSERELGLIPQLFGKASTLVSKLFKAYRLIPDALARIRITDNEDTRDVDVAIEYDAGTEHASFFGRTKIRQYSMLFTQNDNWLDGFMVLTFTSSIRRIISLMEQTVYHQAPRQIFYFAPPEKLWEKGWEGAEIFLDPNDFFVPVRQGSKTAVLEREVPQGAIPKYALVSLLATSPRRVSPREERGKQNKALNSNTYADEDSLII